MKKQVISKLCLYFDIEQLHPIIQIDQERVKVENQRINWNPYIITKYHLHPNQGWGLSLSDHLSEWVQADLPANHFADCTHWEGLLIYIYFSFVILIVLTCPSQPSWTRILLLFLLLHTHFKHLSICKSFEILHFG